MILFTVLMGVVMGQLWDERTMLVDTQWGFSIFVDAYDQGISRIIAQTGKHNEWIIQILLSLVVAQKHVIVVGTHVGLELLVLADSVEKRGLGCKIYGFEPQKFNYVLARKSVILNGWQDFVHMQNVAIGESGQGELAFRGVDSSKAEIVRASTKRKADYKQIVDVFPIYQHVPVYEEYSLVYITANKMEVEVLDSMMVLFEGSGQLSVVMDWTFGINPHKDIDTIMYIVDKLTSAGSTIYKIEGGGFRRVDGFSELTKIKQGKLLLLPEGRTLPS